MAAVIWLIFDYSLLQEYFQARERRNQYREQVAQAEKRQDNLKLEHEALKQGGFPAEKAIRERQRMVKPGEKVMFIETPSLTTQTREK
jgi:cell division protein FtsB